MKRIVYTVAVGKPKFAEMALGLGRSLRLIGDSTRRVVLTDSPDRPWLRSFDDVVPWHPTDGSAYLAKLSALSKTDADEILFIDADCLVFRRLDPIFDYCAHTDLCVQGHPVSDGEWYGDVAGHCRRHDIASMPKFNGGMIYYERTERARQLIATAYELEARSAELGFDNPRVGEEPILSLAMAKTGIGTQCPMDLDFMRAGPGLIGHLNLDVMTNKCSFVCRSETTRFVQPYIFHAWAFVNFLVYWRQLDKLEWIEKNEDRQGVDERRRGLRLRRSIEKRILKLSGRPM